MFKKIDVISILLFGFILRILIGTFTVNWDFLKITQITARFENQQLSEIYQDPLSLYPVLTYYTRYFFIIISKPFLTAKFWEWTKAGDLAEIADPYIFRYLFFLKLPFIAIELFTAYIFSKLVKPKEQVKYLFAWIINPISLYTIAAFTNVDVFPVLFIAISVYFFVKNKNLFSSFFLGIAASYKFFPALIFPFILLNSNNLKEKVKISVIFLFPFIFSQLPALTVPEYWKNSLLAGANRVIFTSVLDIGHGKYLIFFILVYLILFFKFATDRKKRPVFYYFLPLTPVFMLSAFNVQWVYWILPFIVNYQLIFKKDSIVRLSLYLSYFAIIILSQTALHVGMLSPIESTLWTYNREFTAYLGKDVEFLTNIFYSIFSAGIIFTCFRFHIFFNTDKNEKA